MRNFANGKIEVFFGPPALGAPDDLEQAIIKFINQANHSLDIAVQEIDSKEIAIAVLDASYRGISVRVFVEQDYLLTEKYPKIKSTDPTVIAKTREELEWGLEKEKASLKNNREILAAFLRCGIDVKADYNDRGLFHQKFIIRDYRKKRRSRKTRRYAVLTGSTNFTHTGTHNNYNNIIIFYDKEICKAYDIEFDELREGYFGKQNLFHNEPGKYFNIEGIPIRILFAPDNNPEYEVVKALLKSKLEVYFAIFTFSESSGIDDAMLSLRDADKVVTGVMDPAQAGQFWSPRPWLHDKGIELYTATGTKPDGSKIKFKLHHKMMVIDNEIVIAGSMNYTATATELNDENIFIIGSPYEDLSEDKGGPVNVTECKQIANYFKGEILRIMDNSNIYDPGND